MNLGAGDEPAVRRSRVGADCAADGGACPCQQAHATQPHSDAGFFFFGTGWES